MLQGSRLLCIFPGLAAAMLAGSPPALAEPDWMSPEAIRAEFERKQLRGYYFDRITWTATFHEGGWYEYRREGLPLASGTWRIRGRAFCYSLGPPHSESGCGTAKKISANCYEFYLADAIPYGAFDDGNVQPHPVWHSRGWRQEEPPTCEERPAV